MQRPTVSVGSVRSIRYICIEIGKTPGDCARYFEENVPIWGISIWWSQQIRLPDLTRSAIIVCYASAGVFNRKNNQRLQVPCRYTNTFAASAVTHLRNSCLPARPSRIAISAVRQNLRGNFRLFPLTVVRLVLRGVVQRSNVPRRWRHRVRRAVLVAARTLIKFSRSRRLPGS